MTMTKLNSAPPAVVVRVVEIAVQSVRYAGRVTAPAVAGYTFVCWVGFRQTVGYGSYAGTFTLATTDVWPESTESNTTVPAGKKVQGLALYVRD